MLRRTGRRAPRSREVRWDFAKEEASELCKGDLRRWEWRGGRAMGLREEQERRPKAGKWRSWCPSSRGVLLATGDVAWKPEDGGD